MVVVTLGAGLPLMHWPLAFVRQTKTATGRLPLRGVTVIDRSTPTFAVATANATEPLLPGMTAVKPGVVVAASAMMSATGEAGAVRSSVLIPVSGGTAKVLAPAKENCTSVPGNDVDGVIERM